MTAGPPDDFLKKIWKNQPQEVKPMSINDVRAQADAFRLKIRTRIIVGASLGIVLASLFGWQALNETDPVIRMGDVFSAIGALLILWFACDAWPSDLPSPSATPQSIVAYYRNVIARRRIPMLSAVAVALPSLMGLAAITWGHWMKSGNHDLAPYLPIAGLVGLWIVVYLVLQLRRSRALKRKIDDLDGSLDL